MFQQTAIVIEYIPMQVYPHLYLPRFSASNELGLGALIA